MTPFEHAHATSEVDNAQRNLHMALDELVRRHPNNVTRSSLIGGGTSDGVEVADELQPSASMVEADVEEEGREDSEKESEGGDEMDGDEDEYETAEDEDEDDSDEDEDDSDEDEDEDTDSDSDESLEGDLRKKSPYPVFTWDSLDSPPLPLPRHATTLPPKPAKGMLSNPYSASPSSDRTILQKRDPYERWIPPAETMRYFGRPQVKTPGPDRRYDIWLPPSMASHQPEKGGPPKN